MHEQEMPVSFGSINCRQTASFLLGCVFVIAGQSALSSPIISGFLRWIPLRSWQKRQLATSITERTSLASASQSLDFLLYLFLASASVTQFASLSSFPDTSESVCAFVTAWSGITFEGALFVGLLILWLHLRELRTSALQSAILLVIMLLGAGLVLIDHGLSAGQLVPVQSLDMTTCYRAPFLPTGLAASLLFIFLSLFVIARMLCHSISTKKPLSAAVKDTNCKRAIALLVLELLTAIPALLQADLLAIVIPFTLGSLLVLYVFGATGVNLQQRDEEDLKCSNVRRSDPPIIYASQWDSRTQDLMPTNTSQRATPVLRFSYGSILSSQDLHGSELSEHTSSKDFLNLDTSLASRVSPSSASHRSSLTSGWTEIDPPMNAVVRLATRSNHWHPLLSTRELFRTDLGGLSRIISQRSFRSTDSPRREAQGSLRPEIARPRLLVVASSASGRQSVPVDIRWPGENAPPESRASAQLRFTQDSQTQVGGTAMNTAIPTKTTADSVGTRGVIGPAPVSRWSSTTKSNQPSVSLSREVSGSGSSFSTGRPSSVIDLGTILAENWPISP